ncbi:MAG: hypothetical protein M1132_06455 [Chloroflexi bacterium]|nr:hypothetical protein [Chloroflexota bacterium]MCL5951350.1 hypothetical protein [Chloroflexota bacterium]
MEPTLVQIIVYILIAGISAFLAMRIFGTGYPFGFFGAFLGALLGEWLMVNLLHIVLAPEASYGGVPIITAVVGAASLSVLWAIVTSGKHHHRRWLPR